MASSSVTQAASKKKSNMPSMHEPQTVVKIVLIWIGTPAITKVFTIHKSFVCHYSPVFKKIFEDPLNETHNLKLQRSEIDAFSHLVHWLYYQTIQGEDGTTLTSLQLLYLRRLAVKFEMISLENMVIDKLHESLAGDNWSADNYSSLKGVFITAPKQGSTHPWPAAREMLVDILAATRDMAKFDKCVRAAAGYGILKDVAQALKKYQIEGLEPTLRPASHYHVPVPAVNK